MTHRLERVSIGLDDTIAARVADVLRRGLYEVVSQGEPIDELIEMGHGHNASIEFDQAVSKELNHAAALLRCDRARDADGGLLPDVLFSWGCSRWIHYDGIAEGCTTRERIDAAGRAHAECAAEVLEAPTVNGLRVAEIRDINCALAASCDAPSGHDPLIVDAATPWAPLLVLRFGSEILPSPVQPDDDLCRLAPRIAWAGIGITPGEERRTIRIDSFQSELHVLDVPDPLDVMRTILALRAQR